MGYLAAISAALALCAGFLFLTRYEARRGSRFFSGARTRLDAVIERVLFIANHVDFEAFVREEAKRLAAHLVHDIAHLSLLIVRSVERLLTRAVKHLRVRHGIEPTTSAAPRAFVKTMNEFKRELAATRPPYPEIQ